MLNLNNSKFLNSFIKYINDELINNKIQFSRSDYSSFSSESNKIFTKINENQSTPKDEDLLFRMISCELLDFSTQKSRFTPINSNLLINQPSLTVLCHILFSSLFLNSHNDTTKKVLNLFLTFIETLKNEDVTIKQDFFNLYYANSIKKSNKFVLSAILEKGYMQDILDLKKINKLFFSKGQLNKEFTRLFIINIVDNAKNFLTFTTTINNNFSNIEKNMLSKYLLMDLNCVKENLEIKNFALSLAEKPKITLKNIDLSLINVSNSSHDFSRESTLFLEENQIKDLYKDSEEFLNTLKHCFTNKTISFLHKKNGAFFLFEFSKKSKKIEIFTKYHLPNSSLEDIETFQSHHTADYLNEFSVFLFNNFILKKATQESLTPLFFNARDSIIDTYRRYAEPSFTNTRQDFIDFHLNFVADTFLAFRELKLLNTLDSQEKSIVKKLKINKI